MDLRDLVIHSISFCSSFPFLLIFPFFHRIRDHGIEWISIMFLGQLGWHEDASEVGIRGSISASEISQAQEIKRKSPDLLDFDIMNKVVSTMRSFYLTLVKVLVVPNRHRDDTRSLSVATKNVVVFVASASQE